MEKIDIRDFRLNIDKVNTYVKEEIPDMDLITNLLFSKGLIRKVFGLCAEPWDKYFSIYNVDERGVSCVKNPLNNIHIRLNYNTSTRKKKVYFYSVDINYINGFYYFCCLAQSSIFGNANKQHIVYKINKSEISKVLDEIFIFEYEYFRKK